MARKNAAAKAEAAARKALENPEAAMDENGDVEEPPAKKSKKQQHRKDKRKHDLGSRVIVMRFLLVGGWAGSPSCPARPPAHLAFAADTSDSRSQRGTRTILTTGPSSPSTRPLRARRLRLSSKSRRSPPCSPSTAKSTCARSGPTSSPRLTRLACRQRWTWWRVR